MGRVAGFLAALIGAVGMFAGLSGALTFIPFRAPDHLSLPIAEILTMIAALAAGVSLWLGWSGWRLLRHRERAWRSTVAAATSTVVVVAAFAFAMPASSPSPVPGGAGPWVLFSVVAVACSLVILLLYLGRGRVVSAPTQVAVG